MTPPRYLLVCPGPYDVINGGWTVWAWPEPETGNVPDYPPCVIGWLDPRDEEAA